MTATTRSIVIDARVNGLAGGHGLARSVVKLAEHLGPARPGFPVRVLVNPHRPQLFPLVALAERADLLPTGITLGAVHRCRELSQLLRRAGAAVLYVPYPTFTPWLRPCPMVVTIHDCIVESDLRFAGARWRQTGLRLATRAVLRRSAAVTAPTQASLADIRRFYPRAPRQVLIPNGVETGPFTQVSDGAVAAARERYGLPERFVLTVGAHRPHKNQGVLIRALADMPGQVGLVIVGWFDRSFPDPLPGLVDRLGLAARVRFVPEADEELLPAVYRAASVFAFPSLAEGYGLPMLEAMAAGVPVVASDLPVLAEVAGPGALLVPPEDPAAWAAALTRVLADSALAARLTGAGAAVAEAAGWERGGRALHDLLLEVASAGALTGPVPAASGWPATGTYGE